MPETHYAKCRGCQRRRRDGYILSRNGWCVTCAVDNATEQARAVHPGRAQEPELRDELACQRG